MSGPPKCDSPNCPGGGGSCLNQANSATSSAGGPFRQGSAGAVYSSFNASVAAQASTCLGASALGACLGVQGGGSAGGSWW